ncbi:MAG: ATP synthase F1 subunit delta, partial [Peptococcaceae bacterium]|nr:ATP synthase F1 subunit delta [Peptococcaceae bacterium]
MLNEALARRYAEALFEIVANKDLNLAEQELTEVVQLAEGNAEVANVLNHPHVPLSQKKALMEKIIGDQCGITTKNFLYLLIDRRRQTLLPSVLKAFHVLADEARQIIEAKVVSAKALSADQET